MQNPFEGLGKPREDNTDYDEWGGSFECSAPRCRSTVEVAKYIKKVKVLTWVCGNGHVNKLEGVEDD